MPSVVPNNIGIKPMFTVKNPTYTSPTYCKKTKLMLHSTATPGAPAQNFFNGWNSASAGASVEFVLDDTQILQFMPIGDGKTATDYKTWHCGSGKNGSGNRVYIATEVCEPIQAQLIPINYSGAPQSMNCTYHRTYATQRIQMELKYRGYYDGEVDGSFGAKTDAAVKAFQTANGLTADGVVGMATFYKLRDRSGSYMLYDVEGATDFFNGAYNNAVKLFAFLCNYMGAKPSEIICHQEGYRLGIASNHSDVEHYFPLHGKGMGDFRSDVAKYIAGTYVALGTSTISTADQAYLDAVETVTKAGIINTPDYWKGLVDATSVKNNYVMAFIRQAGAYFCKTSYIYGVDAMTNALSLEDPDYWKNATSFTYKDAVELYTKIAAFALGKEPADFTEAVQTCVAQGIINSPAYWLARSEAAAPSKGCMQALMRQAGAFICGKNYLYGIDAIKYAINMNSEPYWKAGSYNVACTKALFKAVAKVI